MKKTTNPDKKKRDMYSQPEFPQYVCQTSRLQTFDDLPVTIKKTPNQLSEAGFFHTQDNGHDRFICFSCGATKSTAWRRCDSPWRIHALACVGICDYLAMVKGSDYIHAVQMNAAHTDWSKQAYRAYRTRRKKELKKTSNVN